MAYMPMFMVFMVLYVERVACMAMRITCMTGRMGSMDMRMEVYGRYGLTAHSRSVDQRVHVASMTVLLYLCIIVRCFARNTAGSGQYYIADCSTYVCDCTCPICRSKSGPISIWIR